MKEPMHIHLYRKYAVWHMDITSGAFAGAQDVETGFQAFLKARVVKAEFLKAFPDAVVTFAERDNF